VAIGVVGQIGPWKGHEDLIEALGILKSNNVPFTCKVFGNGENGYVDCLKKRACALGLESDIQWKGFVDRRADIFEGIDICVVPTRSSEPFGMVAAEASFSGVPTIATRSGGREKSRCSARQTSRNDLPYV